ncbi:hypothetical protein PU634_01955 [Oceanimonas pelagia]|uniref:Uncharacterized protein n=1 Tax=Oceanimonas pelagia TaxID=3028314 RepID=A0AA50KQ20_9GAMM|nr:hypothetical protein [Oceanimonas pelagia]WMC11151.1 hypothetical protein PU634_01955 [Oceanimonas pelagia]
MGALIKLLLLLLVAFFLASEVNLSTSLYRYEDNEIELSFPVWQTDKPWYYLKWNPAEREFEQRLQWEK